MRHLLTFLILLSTCTNSFGLWAYLNSYTFHVPNEGPYVEVFIAVDGKTIDYKEIASGQFQSSIEITMVIYLGEEVLQFKKTTLESELLEKNGSSDLMSIERFSIPNGSYTFEVSIKDLNSLSSDSETHVAKWEINNPADKPFLSSSQFIGAYTSTEETNAFSKSGFDIVPLVSSHYESGNNTLIFYNEIYQTDLLFGADGVFVTNVFVANQDGSAREETRRIKREKAFPVIPGIHQVDISKLPSGDYYLVMEIRDKKNEIVSATKTPFTRTFIPSLALQPASQDEVVSSFAGSFSNKDSLYQIIEAHLPIANSLERNSIDHQLTIANLEQMQSFLYSFWLHRSPHDPAAGYIAYKAEVDAAQVAFGTKIRKGWQTDRGRVYLQYGRPNTRIERPHNPDYFPFEIWHYYETNTLHDRRFLFYNPSLSGDYELLHSDVPGEVQNQDWKQLCRTRGQDSPALTGQRQLDQRDTRSGDELEELYYNPH